MHLDGAMLQYFIYKRENDLWLAEDPVVEVFYALTHLHRVLLLGGPEFIHLATRGEDADLELRVFCRDASRFLGQVLDASAGAIAMSATLEPFAFYRELLGFDADRTETLHVVSPFPRAHRLVLCIDEVDTTYRQRRAHYDGIAGWVARLLPPGRNELALFPSYAFLDAVRDRLPPLNHTVLVQAPGTPDAAQRELLEALASNGSHLVLAVLGGIFAEGVDYPGEMLSEVIVVSPGLPQFNVERELLKAYYQEVYGHGFSYAYLIPGLTRVVQAAGRLIRSAEDRGVIVLMGRRFQDPRYGRLLPEEWTEGALASMLDPDPEAAIRAFFAAG
jgi:DNA excision repair protein ERCC-2